MYFFMPLPGRSDIVSRLLFSGSHRRTSQILSKLPIKTAGSPSLLSASRQGSLGPVIFIAAANTSLTENPFDHKFTSALWIDGALGGTLLNWDLLIAIC